MRVSTVGGWAATPRQGHGREERPPGRSTDVTHTRRAVTRAAQRPGHDERWDRSPGAVAGGRGDKRRTVGAVESAVLLRARHARLPSRRWLRGPNPLVWGLPEGGARRRQRVHDLRPARAVRIDHHARRARPARIRAALRDMLRIAQRGRRRWLVTPDDQGNGGGAGTGKPGSPPALGRGDRPAGELVQPAAAFVAEPARDGRLRPRDANADGGLTGLVAHEAGRTVARLFLVTDSAPFDGCTRRAELMPARTAIRTEIRRHPAARVRSRGGLANGRTTQKRSPTGRSRSTGNNGRNLCNGRTGAWRVTPGTLHRRYRMPAWATPRTSSRTSRRCRSTPGTSG